MVRKKLNRESLESKMMALKNSPLFLLLVEDKRNLGFLIKNSLWWSG